MNDKIMLALEPNQGHALALKKRNSKTTSSSKKRIRGGGDFLI